MKLVILRICGNWYDVQETVNKHDLGDSVISIGEMIGNYTLVAVRLDSDRINELRLIGLIPFDPFWT